MSVVRVGGSATTFRCIVQGNIVSTAGSLAVILLKLDRGVIVQSLDPADIRRRRISVAPGVIEHEARTTGIGGILCRDSRGTQAELGRLIGPGFVVHKLERSIEGREIDGPAVIA